MTGIDVSKHNNKQHIENIIDSQDFIIIRGGYGANNIDPNYEYYVKLAKEHKKPYGVYWFSYATDIDRAKFEAYSACKLVDRIAHTYGLQPLYPIYFDFEYDSARYFTKKGVTFTWGLFNKIVETFCQEVERHGYYVGIYINYDYWKHLDEKLKKRYSIWFANWSNKDYGLSKYPIHMIQTGVVENVDRNVCNVNFPEIIQKNKLNGWF